MRTTCWSNIGRIAIILYLCALFIACQPTPKQEIIVNKGDDTVKNAIGASVDQTVMHPFPEKWVEEMPMTGARVPTAIAFDALAIIPNVKQFPVIEIKAIDIVPEKIEAMMQFFGEDLALHPRTVQEGTTNGVRTKADIKLLIDEKNNLLQSLEAVYVEYTEAELLEAAAQVVQNHKTSKTTNNLSKHKIFRIDVTFLKDLR